MPTSLRNESKGLKEYNGELIMNRYDLFIKNQEGKVTFLKSSYDVTKASVEKVVIEKSLGLQVFIVSLF